MRYHLILPFFGWILKNMFSGVFNINKRYRREMEDHPGLMIFAGTACSVGFTLAAMIVAALVSGDIYVVRIALLLSATASLGYVTFTFFSTLFSKFLDDRQEMFNNIRDL